MVRIHHGPPSSSVHRRFVFASRARGMVRGWPGVAAWVGSNPSRPTIKLRSPAIRFRKPRTRHGSRLAGCCCLGGFESITAHHQAPFTGDSFSQAAHAAWFAVGRVLLPGWVRIHHGPPSSSVHRRFVFASRARGMVRGWPGVAAWVGSNPSRPTIKLRSPAIRFRKPRTRHGSRLAGCCCLGGFESITAHHQAPITGDSFSQAAHAARSWMLTPPGFGYRTTPGARRRRSVPACGRRRR
jgi:hypothetical protein